MILQDREAELAKVYRYKNYSDTMFFRPDLGIHSKRVALMAGYICDILISKGVVVDKNYIIALANMHDDEEIITGDIVSQDKLGFTSKQQDKYEIDCKNAIQILIDTYSEEFMGYSYQKLLLDNNSATSFEYKIMDLADKIDAHCEVCHELFNGNEKFLKEVYFKGYGNIDSYTSTFNRSRERIEKLYEVSDISGDILKEKINSSDMIGRFVVSSLDDINILHTGYEIYDIWIQMQRESFGKSDLERLYTKSNGSIS